MQNYLVYLAYGNHYVNECRYALLKYLSLYNLQPPSSTTVNVYTDKPATFDSFLPHFSNFKLTTVDNDRLSEWKGTQNNPYRAKANVIKDFLKSCDGNF